MRKKKKSQQIHASNRFKERFGINLSDKMICEFKRQISSAESICIRKQSNRVSIHEVAYDGNSYRVVYDKNTKNIVTVFPNKDTAIIAVNNQ